MQPSEKHPTLSKILDDLTETIFGNLPRSKAVHVDMCVSCNGTATAFKDKLSLKESSISGLCQDCQDSVFDK